MPNAKGAPAVITDPWLSDQKDWQYVSIPAENNLGYAHDAMVENHRKFEPGKTYLVPALVAETLNERLKVYAKQCIRILQPARAADMAVLRKQTGINLQDDPTTIQ
jgi:hypothetical protein